MKQKNEVRHSERFKGKVLARWRVLSAQGIPLDRAALEMGLPTTTLEMWVRRSEQPLLVPVQIADERELGDEQRLVVELGHGVRVHGLTLSDVAELARRLS